jgi:hypothetical protein
MGARFVCCQSGPCCSGWRGMGRFHCRCRWRRKPRAPSTLTPNPLSPPTSHHLHLQPAEPTSNPSFPRRLPTLARKVFPGLSALGRGERGSEVLAPSSAVLVMSWPAATRRRDDGIRAATWSRHFYLSRFARSTRRRAWMRCLNGITSSPPNPKAASPGVGGARYRVPRGCRHLS